MFGRKLYDFIKLVINKTNMNLLVSKTMFSLEEKNERNERTFYSNCSLLASLQTSHWFSSFFFSSSVAKV